MSGLVALFPFALSLSKGNGNKITYIFDLEMPLEREFTDINAQILWMLRVEIPYLHTQNGV